MPLSSALGRGPHPVFEAVVYGLLALGAILPSLGHPDNVPGDGVDLYGTLWFFWWIADSLAVGRDPGVTELFFYPYGKDIFAHTGNNFVDAYLAAPLQWLFGNPLYYRVWVVLLMLGNALCFRLLATSVLKQRWAIFTATALFMVNPYLMFELTTGRPTQAFVWFLPLAIWALLEIERGWWVSIFGGVCVALIGYSYWFYAYFFAFAAVVVVAGQLTLRWQQGRPVARYLKGVGLAAVLAIAIVSPTVWAMAGRLDAGVVPGTGDVAGGLFALPPAVNNGVPTMLHGYFITEELGARFYQHPVWAIGTLAWLVFGRGRARWAPVLLVGFLLATGPQIRAFGDDWTMFHYLPLYNGLPFFNRLWFPYRALVLCFLVSSLGMGFLVERAMAFEGLGRWRELSVRSLTALMLAGTLVSERADYTWPLVVRRVTTPAVYEWMAEQGGGVVDLPMGITQLSIVYQTQHGLPLFGGMAENAPAFWPDEHAPRMKNAFIKALKRGTRSPHREPRSDTGSPNFLRSQGFRWVVLHRHLIDSEFNRFGRKSSEEERHTAPFVATQRVTELLGPPVAVDGPLVVWSLVPTPDAPLELRPTEWALSTRTWDRPEPLPYEARLMELGRLP